VGLCLIDAIRGRKGGEGIRNPDDDLKRHKSVCNSRSMIKFGLTFFLVLVLATVSLQAQTRRRPSTAGAKAEPRQTEVREQAWPIASLKINGARLYPAAAVAQATGLRVGQKASKADFEAARDRLVATGAFSTVGYRFEPAGSGGYAATFEVTEIEQAYPFRFEGFDFATEDVRAKLQKAEPLFAERIPGTEEVLKRLRTVATQALAEKGFKEEIVAKVNAEADGSLFVVFRPARLPAVAEVRFRGNKAIDTRTLQQAVASSAVGSIYSEERFQQILEAAIRPLYEAQGRVRARFEKLTVEQAKDVKGFIVTVDVNEGEVYDLGAVSAAGVGSPDKLLGGAGFKSGERYDGGQVTAGLEKMLSQLRGNGYIDAKGELERRIDDEKKKVDVLVRLTPGAQYSFGSLTLKGLDILTEPHIRKLWVMKPSQPFNANYPDAFLEQLRAEQVFENLGKTKSERSVNKDERVVDVTLYFEGDGKQLPAIGAAREQLEREERRKKQYPK
jgi:outer membrane protein insertion porin family